MSYSRQIAAAETEDGTVTLRARDSDSSHFLYVMIPFAGDRMLLTCDQAIVRRTGISLKADTAATVSNLPHTDELVEAFETADDELEFFDLSFERL